MNTNKQLNQYHQTGVQGGVMSASPHQLIQMLMNGALDKIHTAKGHMNNGRIAEKGEQIGWAISIIEGLRISLDKEQGGDIAQNLEGLYNYMGHTLLEANMKNDIAKLDEVAKLLYEIKSAWDAIEPTKPQSTNQESGSLSIGV